jgi:hypothetical protein
LWKLDFEDEVEKPTIEEPEFDVEEARKLEEELNDLDAEEELPEVDDEDRTTD